MEREEKTKKRKALEDAAKYIFAMRCGLFPMAGEIPLPAGHAARRPAPGNVGSPIYRENNRPFQQTSDHLSKGDGFSITVTL